MCLVWFADCLGLSDVCLRYEDSVSHGLQYKAFAEDDGPGLIIVGS